MIIETFKQKWMYKDSASAETAMKQVFRPRIAKPVTPLASGLSARSGPSWQQIVALLVLASGFVALCLWSPPTVLGGLYWLCWACFMSNAVLRLAACAIKPSSAPENTDPMTNASNENLPHYSVIVALCKEADIVPQLLKAMLGLDYPRDRLEILFALEEDDNATIAAFRAQRLPHHVKIIEVPEGFPRTKPRALNHALGLATGDLVVIYDAEDRPRADQLREAARAFAKGHPMLACVQAPLRPVGANSFIGRQFAYEYAVQFDVLLPALHHFNLPFPLGGTSNHFKADILKSLGGWDAYNVTEDADLGLRLAQYGYLSGIITSPTLETPPSNTHTWIPQRTRWIKGYMQTLLVHTRLNTPFRPRAWLGLFLGVGLSVGAALFYAPFTFLVITALLLMAVQYIGNPAEALAPLGSRDLALFAIGAISGMITLVLSARRAGLQPSWRDVLGAPFYWCLQSLAAGFALYQLVTRPFHWDKTEHAPIACQSLPPTPVFEPRPLYVAERSAYGLEHDHQRHPHHTAHQGLG